MDVEDSFFRCLSEMPVFAEFAPGKSHSPLIRTTSCHIAYLCIGHLFLQ